MFTAKPVKRLIHAEKGQLIKLHGDGSQREYRVGAVRDDGLVTLFHKGREELLAIPSHRIVEE